MIGRTVLAFAMTAATTAQAALPPCAYDAALREAAKVVQITEVRTFRTDQPGLCGIDGTVLRNFRGPHAPGTRVRTFFPCQGTGPAVVGAEIYHNPDVIAQSPVVELHVADGGGVAGYGFGLFSLPEATDAPAWQADAACDG